LAAEVAADDVDAWGRFGAPLILRVCKNPGGLYVRYAKKVNP
jgi:hypothetical protein